MTTFFTSDLHFGHANIIRYCRRPFATVQEMDTHLVSMWNDVVQDTDTVYYLGDFSFYNRAKTLAILASLRGRRRFVPGNHDPAWIRKETGWEIVRDIDTVVIGGRRALLCHYPIDDWHGNDLMLHGHSHGQGGYMHNRIDVGVDANDFQMVSESNILRRTQ